MELTEKQLRKIDITRQLLSAPESPAPPDDRWHRDVGRRELDQLMNVLSTIKVHIPVWQGAPIIETDLADVVRFPTSFCPEDMVILERD